MDHCGSIDLCKKTIRGIVSTSSSGSTSSEDTLNATKLDAEHCASVGLCKQTIKGIVSTSSSRSTSSSDALNATKLDTEHRASVGLCKQTIKGIASTSSSGSSSSEDALNATKLDIEHCASVGLCKQTIKGIVSTSSSRSTSSSDALNATKLDTEHRASVGLCKQTIKGIASTSSSKSSSSEDALNATKLDIKYCASVGLCKQTIKGIVSTSSSSEKALDTTKLDITLTNKGLKIYGTWSKDKLLQMLTEKLQQCIRAQMSSLESSADTINDRRLWMTIQSGLYSINVLKLLQEKGMSIYNIIKAMKVGLINLNYCELICFKHFKVEPYILEFKKTWSNIFSDELISNLKTMGLSESECWHIIVHGIKFQSPRILCHLILSGIDVPGILNWQSPVNSASPEIIQFLRHIGINKDIVQLVEQYGIDDETRQMLIDLGLCDMKEKCSTVEEIICECSLTMLESQKSSLDTIKSICETSTLKDISTPINTSDYFQQCNCQCHLNAERKTVDELTTQRNDYLRQNIMVPLAWAIARTIKYNPSDPIHYLMYQLLRWKHDNVTQTKKDSIQEFIALATIEMDRKLIAKKFLDEELIKSQNQEAMKNIPCNFCRDRQQLRRIKERCWKCIKQPFKKYETCEFPQLCSLCKLDVSHKNNDFSSSPHLEHANRE